jgi:hypothetical protein
MLQNGCEFVLGDEVIFWVGEGGVTIWYNVLFVEHVTIVLGEVF